MAAHPYRTPQPRRAPASSPAGEELVLYAALCLIGAIPVAFAIASGTVFDDEPTIGLIMMLAGMAGIAAAAVRRGRLRR